MRIIGGKYRNRRITPPKEIAARPTTDFAKEGLFNILHHSVPLEGIHVLDLFSGTGGIALEFLSRGASKVVSVEQDRILFAHQQRTARDLGENAWFPVRDDVFRFLGGHRGRYDIVFADPPFTCERTHELPQLVRQAGLLGDDGLLIVEHPRDVDLSTDPWYQRTRTYGNVRFSFLAPPTSEPA